MFFNIELIIGKTKCWEIKMSILNSASSRSVYRGYDYFKEGNVISHIQLSDFEYEGEVQGTNKTPYHVMINTKHPKSSSCDCPFANGNTICKHMVALFFAVSPEDLKDYEDWSENDYEDEYEEYDEEDYYDDYEYDRYGNYNKYKSDFIRPIFFDELLSNFVNNLSEEKMRDILISELKKDEESTFNTYLKKDFQRYSSDKNNIHGILDKINNNFYKLSHDYDYNNKDYSVKLLKENEKEKISIAYLTSKEMKANIDKIILNPEIATYNDYKWIASFYKNKNNKKDIDLYTKKLESFFDTLKHYSIKNTIPKSNVLISIYLLNEYNLQEIAGLLIKNCKYTEYVDYIIENSEDCKDLYENFNTKVENEKYLNKEYIAKIYYNFYLRLLDDEIYNQYCYYDFLYNKDFSNLISLKKTERFEYYINKMIKNTKDVITLEKIYIFLDNKEELFKLLFKKENEYRLMANIELLKNNYNNELLKYFKERFYEVLAQEKSRENYRKAAIYIDALYKLNDGKRIVDELIKELKNSEYSKRIALFDEINKVIKN